MEKAKSPYQSLESQEQQRLSDNEANPSKKKKIVVLGILSLVVVLGVVLTLVFTLKSETHSSLV